MGIFVDIFVRIFRVVFCDGFPYGGGGTIVCYF